MTLKLVWPVDIVSCSIKCELNQYSSKILFSKNWVPRMVRRWIGCYDRNNMFLMQYTFDVLNIWSSPFSLSILQIVLKLYVVSKKLSSLSATSCKHPMIRDKFHYFLLLNSVHHNYIRGDIYFLITFKYFQPMKKFRKRVTEHFCLQLNS